MSVRFKIGSTQVLQSVEGSIEYEMVFNFAVQGDVVRYLGTSETMTLTESLIEGLNLDPTATAQALEVSFPQSAEIWSFTGLLESNDSRVLTHRNSRQIRSNQYRWQLQ